MKPSNRELARVLIPVLFPELQDPLLLHLARIYRRCVEALEWQEATEKLVQQMKEMKVWRKQHEKDMDRLNRYSLHRFGVFYD